jgi:predicted aspartyl protease
MHEPGSAIGYGHAAGGRCTIAAALVLALAPWGSVDAAPAASGRTSSIPSSMPQPIIAPTHPLDLVPHDMSGKADYVAGTRPDQIGRIIVNVMVNQRGPFQFALDTGANRTVLTPRLITVLGLHTDDGADVELNGVTGSAAVPTALVELLAAGDLAIKSQRLPVADALTSGIDGILGVDGLNSKRVTVDFAKNRIEIRNARYEGPLEGAMRIPAQMRFGRLMVINAYVNGVRVKGVIDTGSEYTLGNDALRAALAASAQARREDPKIDVVGETLKTQEGERVRVQNLKVGDVQATNFDVVFGEFYVFKLWNLDTQPALVIGMDIIGNLDSMVIDYQRCEVQLFARQRQATASQPWGPWGNGRKNL